MQILRDSHILFWSNNGYFIIYILCLGFIIWEKKDNRRAYDSLFLYSSILLGLIIYNPIFEIVAFKIFFRSALEYVRVFFLLPMYATMAYTITELVGKVNGKRKKVIIVFLSIAVLMITGQTYAQSGNYKKPQNLYKIEDESVKVSDIILNDTKDTVGVLVDTDGQTVYDNWASRDNGLIEGMRQYTAKIQLLDRFLSEEEYQSGSVNLEEYLLEVEDLDYKYIICKKGRTVIEELKNYDFEEIGNASKYAVLKRPEKIPYHVLSNVAEKTVEISGIENTYKLAIINDMHIICPFENIAEEKKEFIEDRYHTFSIGINGLPAEKNWKQLAKEINLQDADLVIFAGDMVDYVSSTTIECLKQGMQEIEAPILYIRSDHDYHVGWSDDLEKEDGIVLQQSICDNPEVWKSDMGEFYVVGIDLNCYQLSESALKRLEEIFDEGKPIILVTHVPLDSMVDNGLREASIRIRNYAGLWGKDDNYVPNTVTQKFLDMVYEKDSPVKAVVAAHLHFAYDVQLTKDIPEYVFAPSYEGNIGIIEIKPEEK